MRNTSPVVADYFTVQYGQTEYESKSRLIKGKTPLISSAMTDNGVFGFFDIEAKFTNVISFPRTGCIGEARVHDYPCCIDNNCLVLIPKKSMSTAQFYYAASVLLSNKWRFRYGRQATGPRIENIELPLIEKVATTWKPLQFKSQRLDVDFTRLMQMIANQHLTDLFQIVKGEGAYREKCRSGRTPLVSASEWNNGVLDFVDLAPTFKAPCITVERWGAKAFVQTADFATVPDDVFVLQPKKPFAIDELFFVATVLNFNRWRYSYHTKVTRPRLERILFEVDLHKNAVVINLTQTVSNVPVIP